jgi:hypothetical protein
MGNYGVFVTTKNAVVVVNHGENANVCVMKDRCQAPLKTKSWYDDPHYGIINQIARCRSKARENSNFCGQHKGMGLKISEVLWKEDDNELE